MQSFREMHIYLSSSFVAALRMKGDESIAKKTLSFFPASSSSSRASVEIEVSFEHFTIPLKRGPVNLMKVEGGGAKLISSDLEAVCDEEFKRWTARVAGPGGLQNLLLVALSLRCPFEGCVVLHSAGVALQDRFLLFPGHSGAGKTTISRILAGKGWDVIGDDVVLVNFQGFAESVFAVVCPFRKSLSRDKFRVQKVFFPIKSSRAEISGPLPAATCITRLISNALYIHNFPMLSAIGADILFSFLRHCECFELFFDKAGNFVKII